MERKQELAGKEKHITAGTLGELLAEKEQLTNRLAVLGREKGDAASRGDLNENAEYAATIEEMARVKIRIREINRDLESINEVVDDFSVDKIGIGTYFTATIFKDGKPFTQNLRLVGSVYNLNAVKGPHIFTSIVSPLGQAVYGKKVGEGFKYVGPKGDIFVGEIAKIVSEEEVKLGEQTKDSADKTFVK